MRQVATRKCLTLGQDKLALQSCDEDNWQQRWYVTFPAGGGTPLLKSAYNDRCITQDGRSVVMSVCAFDNEAQTWRIIEPR
ncbi:ricin-type beta-trefoil lectin domain protein [Streptomyces sp. 8N706]|uniref:ricin-type beta-trefoil lectin domain protein n=1 Tax=Streptomyces sp. 8N706 TaxID=3457416 RepID=UPI003FD4FA48